MLVADGYCNNRVAVFDAETGAFVRQWGRVGGRPGELRLPHGLDVAVHRGREIVLVADRENNRVQMFDLEGSLLALVPQQRQVYDVKYVPQRCALVAALQQPQLGLGLLNVTGIGAALEHQTALGPVVAEWTGSPHSIAVDGKTGDLFVAQADAGEHDGSAEKYTIL